MILYRDDRRSAFIIQLGREFSRCRRNILIVHL